MEDFNKVVDSINKDRLLLEKVENNRKKALGEDVYINFCCWCNAFKNGLGKTNTDTFAEFLKEENIELNFHQKKYLLEKYFNYKFIYNDKTSKYKMKKG